MRRAIKYSYACLPLAAALLAAGCGSVREDMRDCQPEPNVTVYFSLKDDAGNEIFPTTVSRAELFVYDSRGLVVSRSSVSEDELKPFAGKRLRLPAGNYTAVVWANAARSKFVVDEKTGMYERDRHHLLTAVAADGALDDGDPLYYAPRESGTPLTLTVPERGEAEVTAELRHAHVKLDVTVEGYELVNPAYAAAPLRVEVTDLTSRYCFEMNAHGDRVSYIGLAPRAATGEDIYNRTFNIPVFGPDTPTRIVITDGDGAAVYRPIHISELLNESIDVGTLRYLPVIVRFHENIDDPATIRVEVTVDLPGWKESNVTPNVYEAR